MRNASSLEGGPHFIGTRDVDQRDGVRSRLDARHIKLLQLFDVSQDVGKLRAEFFLFLGRQGDARQVRHILDVKVARHLHGRQGSSNLRLISASMASSAAWQSSPSQLTSNLLPGPAASIIRPMMLLPLICLASLVDHDVAGEVIGDFDKHGGGAGVDAQLVENNKFALHGLFAAWFFGTAHAGAMLDCGACFCHENISPWNSSYS